MGRGQVIAAGAALVLLLIAGWYLAGSDGSAAATGGAAIQFSDPESGITPDRHPIARLAVLGDVGTGTDIAWAVAAMVDSHESVDEFEALVLLGDNVYPDGDPDRLDAAVFDPFDGVLDGGTALLAVLGNHDVLNGNGPGQVEKLGMPGTWYRTAIGPALFVGLDSNDVDNPDQFTWVEQTLRESTADFTIVAMHHPPFSAGHHGSNRNVQAQWVPLFERYGVELVLAGHDHDYQRSKLINGVTYVVSGGGAKLRPTDRADFTATSASIHHFAEVSIWEDHIVLRAISQEGVFDHIEIAPFEPGSG